MTRTLGLLVEVSRVCCRCRLRWITDPITIAPTASAAHALGLMDDNHFRNLPAVDAKGTIVGNMTHQAIISYLASRYPVEVLNQPPRPDQFPSKAEGG